MFPIHSFYIKESFSSILRFIIQKKKKEEKINFFLIFGFCKHYKGKSVKKEGKEPIHPPWAFQDHLMLFQFPH